MAGDDGNLVGMIEGKMGVDENEEIGDGSGKGECIGEESPSIGVGIENDGQEGGRRSFESDG